MFHFVPKLQPHLDTILFPKHKLGLHQEIKLNT